MPAPIASFNSMSLNLWKIPEIQHNLWKMLLCSLENLWCGKCGWENYVDGRVIELFGKESKFGERKTFRAEQHRKFVP